MNYFLNFSPTPKVSWFKKSSSGLGFLSQGSELVIEEIQHANQGTYVCKASNEVEFSDTDGKRVSSEKQQKEFKIDVESLLL